VTLPRVALLVIGDGRDDLKRATLESWHEHAREYDLRHVVDVDDRLHALGFCGAIRYGWDRLRELGEDYDYVFHLEEDWRFLRPFSVAMMARLLDVETRVVQVALRRGAEPSEQGKAVTEKFPGLFTDRHIGIIGLGQPARVQAWLEHRSFFTTNPSLYRRGLTLAFAWPEAPRCEAAFTETLIAEGRSFAYWGDREDEPWIEHTGTRTGHGY